MLALTTPLRIKVHILVQMYHAQEKKVLYFLCFFNCIEVQLIYRVVLISAVQQSDSVIHIYIDIVFHILFHYGLPQDVECSSLCYIVVLLFIHRT